MEVQRNMTGRRINYRPMVEAELTRVERERAYNVSDNVESKASVIRGDLAFASRIEGENWQRRAFWYCLKVETGKEFDVEKTLLKANIDAFMPREKWMRVSKGQKIEAVSPFFPSYMLVRFVPSVEAFRGIRTVKHVVDFLRGPDHYHVINDTDVTVFKGICDAPQPPRERTDKSMRDGDKADIVKGPFTGFMCMILSVRWSLIARARVAIDVQGKVFEIDSMPLAFLKKL